MRIGTLRTALLAACTAWLAPAPLLAQSTLADLAAGTRPFERPGTEQEWIVRTVVERMAVLAAIAAERPPAAPSVAVTTVAASPAVFSVAVNGAAPVTVKVVGHIWDARTYAPVATALGIRAEATAADVALESAGVRLVGLLTERTLEGLLSEDRRVSLALRARPRVAGLHEQAALLLGALSLREGAGLYTDGRPAWSRLTAHLAVARALTRQGPPSPPARLAEALLLVELGLETQALTSLAPLQAADQTPSTRAWARALHVRASGDWRILPSPARTSPLERDAYARAYAERAGHDPLLRWMDDVGQEMDQGLSRILLSQRFSLEVANKATPVGFKEELAEAAALAVTYGAVSGDTPEAMLRAIGQPSTSGPFRVLDWPLMASSAERHVLARVKSLYDMEVVHGRRDALRDLPAQLEQIVGALPLAPTAFALMGGDGAPRHLSAAASIVRSRKDAIPPALWLALVRQGRDRARQVTWPGADTWFNPWQPDGTALDVDHRLARSGAERPPLPQVEALHRAAPSATWLSWQLVWWRVEGRKPTIAEAREAFGPALAYDVHASGYMFHNLEGSHDDYVRLATAMCELDPDRCYLLGEQLLKEGHDAEAAEEMRRFLGRARSRLLASQHTLWLTRYLFDRGQVSEARQLAEQANRINSGDGIATLAELLERQGDVAAAEAGYKRLVERYAGTNANRHLGTHYLRRWKATGDAVLRDQGLALVADRFPRGLEAPPEAAAAPYDGVAFTNFGARAGRAGLRQTDVIVGIDGVRVRSESQADVMMRASHHATIRFTVWRDGAYTTVTGTLPQRWFGCGIHTYRPSAAATP